jgi:hypothetical protein
MKFRLSAIEEHSAVFAAFAALGSCVAAFLAAICVYWQTELIQRQVAFQDFEKRARVKFVGVPQTKKVSVMPLFGMGGNADAANDMLRDAPLMPTRFGLTTNKEFIRNTEIRYTSYVELESFTPIMIDGAKKWAGAIIRGGGTILDYAKKGNVDFRERFLPIAPTHKCMNTFSQDNNILVECTGRAWFDDPYVVENYMNRELARHCSNDTHALRFTDIRSVILIDYVDYKDERNAIVAEISNNSYHIYYDYEARRIDEMLNEFGSRG